MVPFYVIGKVQYVFASRHPRRHSARSFSVTSFPYLATSLPPYLLFSDFSPATHFRRSYRSENVQTCQRSDVLTSFTAKSLPFNLFADSHPLTPVTSIFYKNAGGRGHSRRFLSPKAFPCHTSGNSPVSPLAATLMDLPASVGNKRLTAGLTPLDATLTKNRGWGRVLWLTRNPRKDFYPEEHGDDRRFRPCRKGTPLLLVGWSGVSLLRERQESSPLRRGQTQ